MVMVVRVGSVRRGSVRGSISEAKEVPDWAHLDEHMDR